MPDHRRQSNRYLARRLAAAHAVLGDPTATDQQRRRARCRINRTVAVIRALPPVPLMKRGLEIDRLARRVSAAAET